MNKSISFPKKIAESSILIAISIILNFISLAKLPYGGSITLASMLPLILISYRHGIGFGALSGLIFGIINQLFSLNVLTFVTGWQSVVAVIVLDYLLAFTAISLSGLVRKIKNQTISLLVGTLIGAFARYVCHVISGATVWAGLSIPTANALTYSLIYNATFLLPDTLITLIMCAYISSYFNFSTPTITINTHNENFVDLLPIIVGTSLGAGATIFAIVSVFFVLQDANTGKFNILYISKANWSLIGIVTGACILAFVIFYVIYTIIKKNKKEASN